MVPSYSGYSSYLLLTKYNDYWEGGGDGLNRVAVLDPNDTQLDPISNTQTMKEILTVLGPTPDPVGIAAGRPSAVTEWCINTAAIDPYSYSALIGSEDGHLYRWNLATNQLTENVRLAPPLGEPYTPTAIAPDGAVIAINNSTLFVVAHDGAPPVPSPGQKVVGSRHGVRRQRP
jgi:hypothetical protein